jgi:hypothetical protein
MKKSVEPPMNADGIENGEWRMEKGRTGSRDVPENEKPFSILNSQFSIALSASESVSMRK